MEKGFEFVRSGNPFEGLDDYLRADELGISNSQIKYPLQLSLDGFEGSNPDYGLRVRLGYYFELLTHGIYGGRLKGFHKLSNGEGVDRNVITSEPDVVIDEKSCLRESKSVSPGESLKLYDNQLAKYICLQLGNYYKNHPLIVFDIFRHGVRGLISNFTKKPLGDLVDNLSLSTRFMLSLPLSVVVAMHRVDFNKHSSRYEGDKWEHNSRSLSTCLNSLIAYPERTLVDFGLDSNDFNIKKMRFPANVRMNKKEISPFPVLVVRDKNHNLWVEDFRKNGKELYPTLFRLRSKIEYTSEEEGEIKMFLGKNLPDD